MQQVQCEGCGEATPSYDIINCGSDNEKMRALCSQCFNARMAELSGLKDFDNVKLEPIEVTDCVGDKHQFHFQTRLLGDIVELEAFELQTGGRLLRAPINTSCRV